MKKARLTTPYPLEDVTVLGINTVLKPYKLAWLINQVASLKLAQVVKDYSDTSEQPKGHVRYFLFETTHCTFRLAKNGLYSPEGTTIDYLIPNLKQFDFFFTVQDATTTFQGEVFCNDLSATKQIPYVASLSEKKWNRTDLLRVLGD